MSPMTFFLLIIFAVLLIPATMRELDKAWKATPAGAHRRRAGIVFAAALSVCSPYIIWKAHQITLMFAPVPKPLHALWIDYRVDNGLMVGLRSDGETGFVVYRLTSDSGDWAKGEGAALDVALDDKDGVWSSTPMDDMFLESGRCADNEDRNKPRCQADFGKYLSRRGFGISVDKNWLARANHAARTPGSFYRYGRGGQVTIVDPAAGKVYFAYAN